MRRLLLLFGVVLAGCDLVGIGGIDGTYDLVSVDGEMVPTDYYEYGRLVLYDDDTYSIEIGEVWPDFGYGRWKFNRQEQGTHRRDGDELTFSPHAGNTRNANNGTFWRATYDNGTIRPATGSDRSGEIYKRR